MARKKNDKPAGGGCPDWMVTYGDMVTLLLVFFVMLLSMSEVKKDQKFIDFMQAIQEAFGYSGGVLHTPLEVVETPRNVPNTIQLIIPDRPEKESDSPDEGVRGREHTTTSIRRGDRFDVGGKLYFHALSAEMSPEQRTSLIEFAAKLRGHSTQVEVRGHCSRLPVEGSGFASHFELAFARARAVADVLVEAGIHRDRIIVVSAGVNQPIARQAYTPSGHAENDVVEVLEISDGEDEPPP